jgi:hypothetical protein
VIKRSLESDQCLCIVLFVEGIDQLEERVEKQSLVLVIVKCIVHGGEGERGRRFVAGTIWFSFH